LKAERKRHVSSKGGWGGELNERANRRSHEMKRGNHERLWGEGT